MSGRRRPRSRSPGAAAAGVRRGAPAGATVQGPAGAAGAPAVGVFWDLDNVPLTARTGGALGACVGAVVGGLLGGGGGRRVVRGYGNGRTLDRPVWRDPAAVQPLVEGLGLEVCRVKTIKERADVIMRGDIQTFLDEHAGGGGGGGGGGAPPWLVVSGDHGFAEAMRFARSRRARVVSIQPGRRWNTHHCRAAAAVLVREADLLVTLFAERRGGRAACPLIPSGTSQDRLPADLQTLRGRAHALLSARREVGKDELMSLYVEKYGHSMLGDAYGVRRPRDLQMALQGVWLDGDLCRRQGRRRAGGLAIRAGKYYPDPEYERTSLWSFPLHQFGAPIAPARAKGEAAEAPPHGDQSEVFALTQCFSREVDREVADVLEGWPWPYRPAFEPVEVGAA